MNDLTNKPTEEAKTSIIRKKHSPEKERLVKKIIGERQEEEKIEKEKHKWWQFAIEILISVVAIIITLVLNFR
ncbi:MAG TPA: hypothetical protein VLL98_02020 [Rickettsiales bacterium]|nr:hypothetical protein [Rickettsiales bacterium]